MAARPLDTAETPRSVMSEYHSMKRQALLRTLVASAVGLYAVVCTVTTTLSLMAQ